MFQFFMNRIKYLGIIFDMDGHHPDAENVKAFQKIPTPKDIMSLMTFSSSISFNSAFLLDLHRIRSPLKRMLQKGES